MAGVQTAVVLKTPDDREKHRKLLYKHSSAQWKDKYRQRCAERLKASRENFVAHLRGLSSEGSHGDGPSVSEDKFQHQIQEHMMQNVQHVLHHEWEQMRNEFELPALPQASCNYRKRCSGVSEDCNVEKKSCDSGNCEADSDDEFLKTPQLNYHFDDSYNTDLDSILYAFDEITEELLREEEAILIAQYESSLSFSEAALCAVIDTMSDDSVVCPICLKDILHQNKHIIFCACGLRINTANDGITLNHVKQQLEDGSTLHSKYCTIPPVFVLEELFPEMQNLVMKCLDCNFLYIVL